MQNAAPKDSVSTNRLLSAVVLVLVLALLICNAAGSLTSRLAGCLALAATAVLNCVVEILCFDCLDSVHNNNLRIIELGNKSKFSIHIIVSH
jgi:hypothetical protein